MNVLPVISTCHNQLNKIGKISPSGINNLSEEFKQYIRDCTPARLKELAQMNCYAAEKVKTVLDNKFGKNNYTLIAVGRSVSSIAETLGYMGVDTKIIPLSGLRRREVHDMPANSLNTYKSFLEQIGLSKTDLSRNKNKKYILIDYAYYGRSLKRAEELLKKDEIFGDAQNLISLSVNDLLEEDYTNKQFRTLFQYNRFKNFSYVGKLHVDYLKDVYNQCSPERINEYQGNITKGLRKLFWFNVFDSLKEKNYQKINPLAELNALYEHYMSPKAVRNYLRREFEKDTNIIKGITNKK